MAGNINPICIQLESELESRVVGLGMEYSANNYDKEGSRLDDQQIQKQGLVQSSRPETKPGQVLEQSLSWRITDPELNQRSIWMQFKSNRKEGMPEPWWHGSAMAPP